jgi:hypothetical protein
MLTGGGQANNKVRRPRVHRMVKWCFNERSRFGDRSRFAVEVGESSGDTDAARRVDVWAAGVWLTCDDNNVYVPHFAGCLQHAVGSLLVDPTHRRLGRPYPELSFADNYRRLRAEEDNTDYLAYRFMDWGPTADNVGMLLFREGGTAVLHDAAWCIMWAWADRSRWPKQAEPDAAPDRRGT